MKSSRLLHEILFTRPAHRALLILSSLSAALCGLAAAFSQKEFVDGLLQVKTDYLALEYSPLTWLGISFVFLLLHLVLNQLVNFVGNREALFMQRQLADRLYRRVLELQSSDLRGRSVGEIVSIYTTDVPGSTILLEQSMPQGFSILFPLVLAPWALIQIFHLPVSFVVGLLAAVIMVNLALAFRQSRFFFYFKKLAADRIGLVNEWIQNIRTLRVLGLTEAFENQIIHVREVETANRIRMLTNGQSMNAISSSMTFLINVILILVLVKSNPTSITPGNLLALLWIVGVFLTRPFRQLPWFFTFVFDGWTSLRRVASALALLSTPPRIESSSSPHVAAAQHPPALWVKNLTLKLQGQSLLRNINLRIEDSEFIAFVGEVGSGKSLLLQSLLGETPAHFEAYQVQGRDMARASLSELRSQFAFVPQEGFTMSASLLENVLFDYQSAESQSGDVHENVTQALRHSEFDPHSERLTSALKTEIGERGVNLSGGQKQRISLARAVFSHAPILLLDDTFSALDADTERKLIDRLFHGKWKNRTRLLVTHRLSVLPRADRIYFLADGEIIDSGSWADLRTRSSRFNEFIQSLEKKNEKQRMEGSPV